MPKWTEDGRKRKWAIRTGALGKRNETVYFRRRQAKRQIFPERKFLQVYVWPYSFNLLRKPRSLMPSISAVRWRWPPLALSVAKINCFSASFKVMPTSGVKSDDDRNAG